MELGVAAWVLGRRGRREASGTQKEGLEGKGDPQTARSP